MLQPPSLHTTLQTDRPLDVRTYIEPARRFEVSHPSMWPHKCFVMIPTITVNMAHVAQSLWLCVRVRVRLLFPSDFLRQMDQTKMTMVSYLRTNTLQSTSLLTVYLSFSRSSHKKQVVLQTFNICYTIRITHKRSTSVYVNLY